MICPVDPGEPFGALEEGDYSGTGRDRRVLRSDGCLASMDWADPQTVPGAPKACRTLAQRPKSM